MNHLKNAGHNAIKLPLLTIAWLVSLLLSTSIQAAPGSLDTSFNALGASPGLITTTIDSGHDDPNAIAVSSDGKILVAGRTRRFDSGVSADLDFALLRYNADGTLDSGFGVGGITTSNLTGGGDETANALAVLPDGNILVAGRVSGIYILARYTAAGALDTSFAGGTGFITVNPTAGNDNCFGMAITSAGKIVLTGNADYGDHSEIVLVQVNANGTLDTSFGGGDGIVITNPIGGISSDGHAVAIQSDGKILVAGDTASGGSSTYNFALLRFDENGNPDTTFDTDGVAIKDVGGFADYGRAIAIQSDGSIVVAGDAFISGGTGYDFAVARFLTTGALDTTFGTSGVSSTPIFSGIDKARAVVIQPDGKIIVAGFAENPANDDFALVRYNSNGSLDSSFGTGGIMTTVMGGNSWEVETGYALALQTDGKVLLVESNDASGTREVVLARYMAEAWDITPAAFTFTDVTGATTSSTQTSASMTVSGLGTGIYVPVTITGGEYVILPGSTYSSNIGYVTNGNQISVRHTSSSSISTQTNTVLTIGGLHAPNNTTLIPGTRTSDTFSSTTDDLVPNSFSFTNQTGVATSTTITSNSITVSGVAAATAISVSGGSYSINGGTYTGSAGTVVNGNTVTVRHASSASASTLTSTTLTIGGVSDTFTSTTADDVTPDAFSFTDQTAVTTSTLIESASITVAGITAATTVSVTNGEYSVNGGSYTGSAGTLVNGNTVRVRHTSAATASTAVNSTLTIGGVSDTFTSTTADDVTPDAFVFTDVSNVVHSTQMTSNSINIADITAATTISVTGGTYSINGGAYTSTGGTVMNGNSVTVRHTSSAADSTAVNTTLTIGGVPDTFSSTTSDLTPAGFTFTDQSNAAHGVTMTSNAIVVSGITSATAISVSGGTYSINGEAYTGISGTVINGDSVTVRHTSSAADSTAVNTTLTIGGVPDTFSSTSSDLTPADFSFTDLGNVGHGVIMTSNAITVADITAASAISVTGGTYSIDNGATYTSAPGTVVYGNTVSVRHTSSASDTDTVSTTLTIGGVSDTYSSTTSDLTPVDFSFSDQTAVTVSTLIESDSITVTGITAAATISVTNGEYSINGGSYTSSTGVVVNGNTVSVRHTTSTTASSIVNTVLTIGSVTDNFTSTTEDDATPDAFSFAPQTSVTPSALITSEVITITGISIPVTITVSDGSTYQINSNNPTSNPGVVTNGDQIVLRHVAAAMPATRYQSIVTIGGISGTFTSTTAAATPPAQTDGGGGAVNFLWIIGFAATLVVRRRKKLVAWNC